MRETQNPQDQTKAWPAIRPHFPSIDSQRIKNAGYLEAIAELAALTSSHLAKAEERWETDNKSSRSAMK